MLGRCFALNHTPALLTAGYCADGLILAYPQWLMGYTLHTVWLLNAIEKVHCVLGQSGMLSQLWGNRSLQYLTGGWAW